MGNTNPIHELMWQFDADNSPLRQYLYRYRPDIKFLDPEIVQNCHWHSYLNELGDIFEVKELLPPLTPSERDISSIIPILKDMTPKDVEKYLVSPEQYIEQISKPQALPYFHSAAAAARYLGDEFLFKTFIATIFAEVQMRRKAENILVLQVEILSYFLNHLNSICCFTEDPCSNKMWDFYGGGSRGYCIGYICGSMQLNPNFIHRVEYRDDFTHFSHEEISRKDFALLKIPTTKGTMYADEREWRSIQYRATDRKEGGLYESMFPICEITLGARMAADDARAVITAARSLPVIPRIYEANASIETGTAVITREAIEA